MYDGTTKLGSSGVIGSPATVPGPVLPFTGAVNDQIFLKAYEFGPASLSLRADGSATALYVVENPSW